MCNMNKTRDTFNVFTAQRFGCYVAVQNVPPHLFLAQVDAANTTEAREAVARDMGVHMDSVSAQYADDPRAQGQRHATAEERARLTRDGGIIPTKWLP